jgi:hypothetical protein
MCPNHPYRFSVANLSHRGRRVRLILGTVGSILTLGLAASMIYHGVHPLWRWMLVVPAFASILCLVQAFASTCVVLAVLGAWDMGCGTERVPDPRLDAALRSRSWKIVAFSAIAAFGFALASTYCPGAGCGNDGSYAKGKLTELEVFPERR